MTMRAVYSTGVQSETLKAVVKSMAEFGMKITECDFDENFLIAKSGDKKVVIGIVNRTVYVNQLGTFVPRLLEKNGIRFEFSQHSKVPDTYIEDLLLTEEYLE